MAYYEYVENCPGHPNGAKTELNGFARRGATQLEFHMVVALDSAAALEMVQDILGNFAGLTN